MRRFFYQRPRSTNFQGRWSGDRKSGSQTVALQVSPRKKFGKKRPLTLPAEYTTMRLWIVSAQRFPLSPTQLGGRSSADLRLALPRWANWLDLFACRSRLFPNISHIWSVRGWSRSVVKGAAMYVRYARLLSRKLPICLSIIEFSGSRL